MRILLVSPGASWSTYDVWRGYDKALRQAGHEVVSYALDGRIHAAGGWLTYCWRKAGKPDPKPGSADFLYAAGQFLLERALRHQVDWVLCISAMYVHPDLLVLLRRAGVRVAVLFTESPYDMDGELGIASLVDCVFTNERTAVPAFREVCPSAHYLRHAYDPEVHRPFTPPDDTPAHDVVFVGTGFQERCDMLGDVDWSGIDLGLYGAWTLLGSRNKLRQHLRGGIVPNDITVAMYQAARVGLNIHRTSIGWGKDAPHIEHAESVNPRVIELAACKVFQLSDWREEMADLFPFDIPVFTDADGLQAHIRHYLDAPADRQQLAEQMYQAIQGETFDARVPDLIKALESA